MGKQDWHHYEFKSRDLIKQQKKRSLKLITNFGTTAKYHFQLKQEGLTPKLYSSGIWKANDQFKHDLTLSPGMTTPCGRSAHLRRSKTHNWILHKSWSVLNQAGEQQMETKHINLLDQCCHIILAFYAQIYLLSSRWRTKEHLIQKFLSYPSRKY